VHVRNRAHVARDQLRRATARACAGASHREPRTSAGSRSARNAGTTRLTPFVTIRPPGPSPYRSRATRAVHPVAPQLQTGGFAAAFVGGESSLAREVRYGARLRTASLAHGRRCGARMA